VPLYAGMEFSKLVAPVSLERKTAHYIYEGMSYTTDVREGLQWASLADQGSDKIALRFIAPLSAPDGRAEFTLVAPRVLYDDGRLLAEAGLMQPHLHRPRIMISRSDADKMELSNGDSVTVAGNGAALSLPVLVDRQVGAGVVLVARNLAGRPAERLIGGNGFYTTVTVKKS